MKVLSLQLSIFIWLSKFVNFFLCPGVPQKWTELTQNRRNDFIWAVQWTKRLTRFFEIVKKSFRLSKNLLSHFFASLIYLYFQQFMTYTTPAIKDSFEGNFFLQTVMDLNDSPASLIFSAERSSMKPLTAPDLPRPICRARNLFFVFPL